jgi:hypothetical protein
VDLSKSRVASTGRGWHLEQGCRYNRKEYLASVFIFGDDPVLDADLLEGDCICSGASRSLSSAADSEELEPERVERREVSVLGLLTFVLWSF